MSDRPSAPLPPDGLVERLSHLAAQMNPQVRSSTPAARRRVGQQMAAIGLRAATLPAPVLVGWLTGRGPRAKLAAGAAGTTRNPNAIELVLKRNIPKDASKVDFPTFYRVEFTAVVAGLVFIGSPAHTALYATQDAMATIRNDWHAIDDPNVVVRRLAVHNFRQGPRSHWLESLPAAISKAENDQLVIEARRAGLVLRRSLRPLSEKDAEIVMWYRTGLSDEQIGRELSIEPRLVRNHIDWVRMHVDIAVSAKVDLDRARSGLSEILGPDF